jgi:hypothetical protein
MHNTHDHASMCTLLQSEMLLLSFLGAELGLWPNGMIRVRVRVTLLGSLPLISGFRLRAEGDTDSG